MLVDHSKFTNSAFIHVAPLEQVDVLITDADLDRAAMQELSKRKVEVIQVPGDA